MYTVVVSSIKFNNLKDLLEANILTTIVRIHYITMSVYTNIPMQNHV